MMLTNNKFKAFLFGFLLFGVGLSAMRGKNKQREFLTQEDFESFCDSTFDYSIDDQKGLSFAVGNSYLRLKNSIFDNDSVRKFLLNSTKISWKHEDKIKQIIGDDNNERTVFDNLILYSYLVCQNCNNYKINLVIENVLKPLFYVSYKEDKDRAMGAVKRYYLTPIINVERFKDKRTGEIKIAVGCEVKEKFRKIITEILDKISGHYNKIVYTGKPGDFVLK